MAFQQPYTRPGKARKRPQYAFIWPKDGKRTTKLGRWADIFTNRGPDIHIATHRGFAGNRNLGWDSPTRAQWSQWGDFEDGEDYDPWEVDNTLKAPWWARRASNARYDFHTRRWRPRRMNMWSDVEWETGARTRDQNARRFRSYDGHWYRPEAPWMGNGRGYRYA